MAIPTANLSKIAFSSEFNYERISIRGTRTSTLGAAPVTIPHNLGYKPYARVWVEWPTFQWADATQNFNAPIGVIWYVDNTNLYIEAYANNEGTFGNAVTFAYRIYEEDIV